MKNRLDKELVDRGLVPSRAKAQELIKAKYVVCDGKVIDKNNYMVSKDTDIVIKSNDKLKYVSRGGLKLEKAIEVFKIDFNGLTVMDIGSSTGGFTDCSLKHGAKKVIAIDVGTNLLHESLRNDPRIELYEQTNFKELSRDFFNNIDIFVCDVSFISLKHIITKLVEQNIKIDIICLIKPQFECGRDIATKYKGVILNKNVHLDIVHDLNRFFNSKGLKMPGLTISPIQGGDGNIEYLIYLSNRIDVDKRVDINKIVDRAFENLK